MAGSEAEERIRAKVERMLRHRFPDARIIHELQLEQGGVRIDVAAVAKDRLVLAEIKSERDVLKRLPAQIAQATRVADEVWVCIAEKHLAAVQTAREWWGSDVSKEEKEARLRFSQALYRCTLYVEKSLDPAIDLVADYSKNGNNRPLRTDPYERFELLWAGEMRSALGRFFGGATLPGSSKALTRGMMAALAVEHMSGREIRRAVCEQLRERPFPRADAPKSREDANVQA